MCNCDLGQGCRAKRGSPSLGETLTTAAALHHLTGGDYKCSVDTCPASSPSKTHPLDGCTKITKGGGAYCQCGKSPSPSPDTQDMYQAYEIQPGAAQKTPDCPTGLQFPNLWAEGYGDG